MREILLAAGASRHKVGRFELRDKGPQGAPQNGSASARMPIRRARQASRGAQSQGKPRAPQGLSAAPPRTSCSPSLLLTPPVSTYASNPRSTRI
jgi:hypothetical protein